MQVQCVLCDNIEDLDNYSLQAKRLRNRKINLYLCGVCYKRISNKTIERHATGNFHLYDSKKNNKKDDLI